MEFKECTRHLFIVSILLMVALQKADGSIHCSSECGHYHEDDMIGQNLHQQCHAFDKKCPEKEQIIEHKRKRKKKSAHTRIVGGQISKYPIPWMVLLTWHGPDGWDMCGGALINSQWVVTAVHCPCKIEGFCSRGLGEIAKEPIKIKDDVKLKERAMAFLGATAIKAGKMNWDPVKLVSEKPENIFYEVKKVFLHPEMGTIEDHPMSPDIALVKLSKRVEKFSNEIRPICLPKPYPKTKQTCSDGSFDEDVNTIKTKPPNKKKWMATKPPDKMLGGCGTIAGWGDKYDSEMFDNKEYEEKPIACTTDSSNVAPSRNKPCITSWTASGKEHHKCTTVDMKVKDISKNCARLYRELRFQKLIKSNKYLNMDLNEWVNKQEAPIEGLINKKKVFHCSKTDFTKERENPDWNGWCATKLDDKGKIEEWGMCAASCKNDTKMFTMANMNLLTDDECATLNKDIPEDSEKNMMTNFKTEFCAGKKSRFPKEFMSLKRKKKTKKKRNEEKKLAKKENVGMKPTIYFYNLRKKPKTKSIDLPENYTYNWFLGGVDSCQGDSGGPLWTNIEDSGGVRATLLGVVSRGNGCAAFNAPATYGSITKTLGWVKKTVHKESHNHKKLCPSGSKDYDEEILSSSSNAAPSNVTNRPGPPRFEAPANVGRPAYLVKTQHNDKENDELYLVKTS